MGAPASCEVIQMSRPSPSRWVFHQACGMAAVQLGVDIDSATARILAQADAEGRPAEYLAQDIVDHRTRLQAPRTNDE